MSGVARVVVVLVFVAVILGVPAYELCVGKTSLADVPWTWSAVRAGATSAQIDRALANDSAFAEVVRPSYHDGMFVLFRATAARVVVGQDDWLFHGDYVVTHAGGVARLPETTRAVGDVDAWLGGLGTRLAIALVPRKATIYPGQLPDDLRPPYRSSYDDVLGALRAAGVATVDLRPALDPARGLSFLPHDPHWTPDGARRAASAIAEAVLPWFPDGLPGTPIETRLVPQPATRFPSGLVRMLGVPDDGRTAERYAYDRATIAVVDARSGATLPEFARDEPIVLVGTSMSRISTLGELLTHALRRRVRDESREGRGAGWRLADVLAEIVLGERPAPRLIVWEFPEEFPVHQPEYFADPLRDFAALGAHAPLRERELRVRSRTLRDVELRAQDDGRLRGVIAGPRPALVYELEAPLPGDGSAALSFRLQSPGSGHVRVLWDSGRGYTPRQSRTFALAGLEFPHRVVARLAAEDGAPIVRICIVPIQPPSTFELWDVSSWSP